MIDSNKITYGQKNMLLIPDHKIKWKKFFKAQVHKIEFNHIHSSI